jgi:glycosyltransferase involved in cell wall biosynthesis
MTESNLFSNHPFPLVTVIMPVFNAEKYIYSAIESLILQTYQNWELIIINDGCTDGTEDEILKFDDSRIRYFKQENKGVSAARNVGLNAMKGSFFCFLDADDCYTSNSIESRIKVFETNPEVEFVDGTVLCMDSTLSNTFKIRRFNYYGNPFLSLVRLEEKCFLGQTWMIRFNPNKKYQFDCSMTHAEDLMFFISISSDGIYSATNDIILKYRIQDKSAMSNLKGLEKGYIQLFKNIKNNYEVPTKDLKYLQNRIVRIMFLSYMRNMEFFSAFKSLRLLFSMG